MIISVVAVLCTAVFVLNYDGGENTEDIKLTVVNTSTSIPESSVTTVTTIKPVKTTTTSTSIMFSSISTNNEPLTTSTEPVTESPEVTESILIDINTAGTEELIKLKGIGEVIAGNIIAYRESNGGFRNIEEIMNVSGIGEGKFADIRDFIYVQNPTYPIEEVYESPPENPPEESPPPPEETPPEITLEDIAPININNAGVEELILLPHVDWQIAQDIITLREQIGGFQNVYELLLLENLTQKQFSELEEFVTVGQ